MSRVYALADHLLRDIISLLERSAQQRVSGARDLLEYRWPDTYRPLLAGLCGRDVPSLCLGWARSPRGRPTLGFG